jgi:crotonobetainyl-CoA:carnitine CoA-transferase CaiB-like acyl-CoA transferase
MILGSMNADVIKIEPIWGEMARLYPPLINGESSPFMFLNRNKMGMALNLKAEKGKQIFFELLKRSDVVVENFKRGKMDKLGLGYNEMVKVEMFCNIDRHHLIGEFRWNPHLQGTP